MNSEDTIEYWRSRAVDLAKTLNAVDALVYRLTVDDSGAWIVTFVDGHLPVEHPYSTDRVAGSRLNEIIPPDVFAAISPVIAKGFSGERAEYEVEYTQGRWLAGRVAPFVHDDSGKVTEIICTNLEVTDRVVARTEASEHKEWLEALVAALPDMMFIFNSDGVYVDYIIRDDALIYAPVDQILGANIEDLLPANVASGAKRILDIVLASGRTGEFRYNLKIKGREEYFHARIVPFGGDKVMAVVRNVSDLVRSEQEVRAKAAQMEVAQKVAGLGYWSFDIASMTMEWSSEIYRLMGVSPGTIPDMSVLAGLLGPDEVDRLKSLADDVVNTNQIKQIELGLNRSGDDRRRFLLSMALTPELDSQGGVLRGTLQEITELRKLEVQLFQAQKMDSLGRMASAIAHDFNNMLQIVHGYSERLARVVEPETSAASYVSSILKTSERAGDLVDRILSFSRQSDNSLVPVVLDDFVRDCVRLIDPLMGKFHTVVLQTGCGNSVCNMDQSGFEQVLMNLAVNARDAMPDGGDLRISTRLVSEGTIAGSSELLEARMIWPWLPPQTDMVSIEVSDCGNGIPEAIKDRIFDPFFTTKERGAGTGLGLSTAYSIVRRHGGGIHVKESGPTGTTFRIMVPLA